MIFDSLDIQIIYEFYKLEKNQETTTWEITKKIFPNHKSVYEQRKNHDKIKNRLHRLDSGIFTIKKNKKGFYEYELNKFNVKFCRHKFPCGIRNSVMILGNGKWIILEL